MSVTPTWRRDPEEFNLHARGCGKFKSCSVKQLGNLNLILVLVYICACRQIRCG